MCSIGINRNSNKTSFINDFNQDTVNKEAFNYAKNDSESDQYEIFLFCEMFSVYLRKKIWIRLDWMTQWIKIVRKIITSWFFWKTNESWNFKFGQKQDATEQQTHIKQESFTFSNNIFYVLTFWILVLLALDLIFQGVNTKAYTQSMYICILL